MIGFFVMALREQYSTLRMEAFFGYTGAILGVGQRGIFDHYWFNDLPA